MIALRALLPATMPELAQKLGTDLHHAHSRMAWYRRQGLVRKVTHGEGELAVWKLAERVHG